MVVTTVGCGPIFAVLLENLMGSTGEFRWPSFFPSSDHMMRLVVRS